MRILSFYLRLKISDYTGENLLMTWHKFLKLLTACALTALVCAGCDVSPPVSCSVTEALNHIRYLSETIGPRTTGSEKEQAAREYIREQLESLGYSVAIQEFSFESGSVSRTSANVIAKKPGASEKVLFIGGHYDSVAVGRGACDNGSGTSLLLALAERLRHVVLPYTVCFIAFGAEEEGMFGSQHYVEQLTDADIDAAIGMINLDTVVAGDYLYVYGGAGDAGWMREQALDAAAALGITFRTNPGLNPDYPAGTAGDWSDHAPFRQKGIPYAYFEATNWDIGELDGYMQTVEYGEIYHTDMDTLTFIESAFPGRIEQQLTDTLKVLIRFLRTIKAPENETRMPVRVRLMTRDGRELSRIKP
jgi:alkaline phosphatase isozyme conversion protein